MIYVVIIAVVNLGLGFALALALGRGPIGLDWLPWTLPARWWPAGSCEETTTDEQDDTPPPDSTETLESPAQPPVEPVAQIASRVVESESKPAPPPRDQSEVEVSIDGVLDGLKLFRSQLGQIDSKVRKCAVDGDAKEMQGCVREIQQANRDYLKQTSVACDRLDEIQANRLDALAAIGEKVQNAIAAQMKDVEAAGGEIGRVDLAGDFDGGCKQLLHQTSQLVEANASLHSDLEGARLEVARTEGWIGDIDSSELIDELTQLPSRAAFEQALDAFWNQTADVAESLTVAMIDIDNCHRLNSEHGPQISDRVVRAVAQVIAAAAEDERLVARYGGQKFVLRYLGQSPREATDAVERVRQVVKHTQFTHDGELLEVTVSCAATATTPDDTADALFERLRRTLLEAKRYGRNRTFLHEGKYPAPVVPPDFTIEGQTYEV